MASDPVRKYQQTHGGKLPPKAKPKATPKAKPKAGKK